ncbi:MAG: response regulator transcription factor [Firmicutes bacterium]|nr:response regulator transcription factor [Bacillota bacterium]MCL5039385.1 response regulator transcription factor [Bacillota bacterium]
MPDKVLVVDDESSIVQLVTFNLEKEGFQTVAAHDGLQALQVARTEKPDLIILDVMLPGLDGFEVCRILSRELTAPIILLTARKEEIDRVVGLEIGADDYVTKPFSPRELVARVKAILRRRDRQEAERDTRAVTRGALLIDLERHQVLVGGRALDLTPTEFEVIRLLAAHPGRVFSREALLEAARGSDAYIDLRTVDVHIRHLREKLGENHGDPRYIETVRGVGYRFKQDGGKEQ